MIYPNDDLVDFDMLTSIERHTMSQETTEIPIGEFDDLSSLLASSPSLQISMLILILGLTGLAVGGADEE